MMISGAVKSREKTWLDGRREILREKVSRIRESVQADGNGRSRAIEAFGKLLEGFSRVEQLYESLLLWVPTDSSARDGWYVENDSEFRTISGLVDDLICEANGLLRDRSSFREYGGAV
jgi:hypothetical protein